MKANELRIWNWYQWYAEGKYYEYQVKDIDFCNGNMINFEPIPLTEEWLVRFGFRKSDLSDRFIIHGWFYFEKSENGYSFRTIDGFVRVIESVHQLQNLYFALTGEELELKSDEI